MTAHSNAGRGEDDALQAIFPAIALAMRTLQAKSLSPPRYFEHRPDVLENGQTRDASARPAEASGEEREASNTEIWPWLRAADVAEPTVMRDKFKT